jgi:hypothetical protein
MSRTTKFKVAFVVGMVSIIAAGSCNAQTLGELAEAQRIKQRTEIAKIQREAAAEATPQTDQSKAPTIAPAIDTATMRKVAETFRPKIVVHALYARDGVWVAELAEGQRLSMALVGMQIRGQKVIAVEQRGLVLSKACTAQDVREKAQCGTRIVNVGGVL